MGTGTDKGCFLCNQSVKCQAKKTAQQVSGGAEEQRREVVLPLGMQKKKQNGGALE